MSVSHNCDENRRNLLSEVESAISNNDLATLKQLLPHPFDQTTLQDENGNNPLHLSIIYEKNAIFDYLLDKFDLEAQNHSGHTALSLSLLYHSDIFIIEYFALELIRKGANIEVVFSDNNTVLHLALQRHYFQVAQLVIEKGADLNVQNDAGCTPLHMLFHVKTDPEGVTEGVGLMLYHGADASVRDKNGNVPFELAVIYDRYIKVAQENLFFYTFDSNSSYEMSDEVLFELLESKSSLFFQIVDYVSEVVFVSGVTFSPFLLFRIDPNFLKVVIGKFDYVVRKILACPPDHFNWFRFRIESLQNWEILLASHLSADTIEFIGRFSISWLVKKLDEDQVPPKIILGFLFYLLSYGLEVSEIDVQAVYKKFGYCDLFKTFLHLDIKKSKLMNTDILPKLIYDVSLDLGTFLTDPHDFSINAIENLLDYYADPQLRQFCNKLGVKKLVVKSTALPQVPLLVQLARDTVRKYLVEKFSIRHPKQFFSLLKQLPISHIHEKILSFETKLY
ncbi:ankyrin-3 [Tribolium castaneum]|uniref:Uncharacterized protein n=1 Tax=Tribolium castaneum TaxID=7070 RepID=D6WWM7_TRICA|nr:PREDICTED: ankyrin-3 [Tribolium castaneum]EFA08117.1 hypothetical protein TcasGA2_TC005721 [Tribolium castaneum]|eukprot:XP_975033.1 PREDICTED: ankyrin-3 [Tribolium castaneum]